MSQFVNEIEDIFSESGLLSKLPNYEYREPQQKMAVAVADSLENDSHCIIEAPTGIGKSFAYLVPAIVYTTSFAKEEKRKAIISTCTINLQEQLIKKDIPALQKILPYEFKPEILKGRNNYICTKRLNYALMKKSSLFASEEQEMLQKIYDFVNKNDKGTLQEIPFKIDDNIWSQIFAEEGVCTSKSCGTENSNCFYQQAKIKLKHADLIILNHYLFFTIFGLHSHGEKGYIYSNDYAIFDEAHRIEQIAAENVSPSISKEMIKFWLHRLFNPNKDKGFLADKRFRRLCEKVNQLITENDYYFQEVERYIYEKFQSKRNHKVIRIREPFRLGSPFEIMLKEFAGELLKITQAAQNEDEENEIKNYCNKLAAFSNTITDFMNQSFQEHVYWVEAAKGYRKNTKLCMSPINMAEFFRNNIFNENGPAIMTSATLSVNRSLEYFKRSAGAEEENGVIFDSPFDLKNQMKVYISKDMPDPKQNHLEKISDYFEDTDYEIKLKEQIQSGITKTGGGALVLFTNTKLMRKMYEKVANDMRGSDIMFYAQGEGLPKVKLLKEFENNCNSVLFGVDSFWMGIDIPGDSLRNVIITKLPFDVPEHPIIEAKIEYIQQNGGNPFMEFYLPGAILKFKQGIGRLIRNNTDKGIVVILDSRILHKFYGKMFVNSLPECEIVIE